jgi:ACS family tartrate transporter-like MFS transporter
MISEKTVITEVGERARRRIVRRIMPFLFVLYIVAYLDRVNVGYAGLQMRGDLGFSDAVFGFGAGIFFIGYFLLEIPGSLIAENWSARGWIARIMISWGVLAICTGFIHSSTHFYIVRLVLGAAEAGFFPGIIVYLTHWFRYEDRAKAVAMFMAAIPISNILGSPISGLILRVHWLGLAGWRWLFIIEGAPAIILGVVTIFYLTDWPHQARWLPEDERDWITSELDREKHSKLHDSRALVPESRTFMGWGRAVIRWIGWVLWQAIRHREVTLLALAYFFIVTSVYGLNFWMPTILKRVSGSSDFKVTLLSAIPYCVGLAAMLVLGWSSDKTGERRWHTALPMLTAGAGLLLSLATQNNAGLAVSAFCVAAMGLNGYLPGFWALPTRLLSGSAAAAAIGLINSVGNLGGFVGPYIVGYLTKAGSFFGGVLYLSISAIVAAGFILALRAAPASRVGQQSAGR